MAEGVLGDEPLGHALAALDPRRVVLSSTSAAGQEERIRRFARVFTALPAPPTGPPAPRLPSGVVARAIRSGADTYLALANDTPYPILLEADPPGPARAPPSSTWPGASCSTPRRRTGPIRLVLELAPFGVSAIRIGSPEVAVASATPYPGAAVLDGHEGPLRRPPHRPEAARPALPGGDPAVSSRTGPPTRASSPTPCSSPPRGLAGRGGLGGRPRLGRGRARPRPAALGPGSLRLDARGGPAAVVSEPFQPRRPVGPDHPRLAPVRPARRPGPGPDRRPGGGPALRPAVRRRRPGASWAEAIARASQLPDGGLDSARLRFELLGPGRLWVDDVSVVGDALSESERLNARRDLTAALSAYREKRYADFARLAGSHWAQARRLGPGRRRGRRPLARDPDRRRERPSARPSPAVRSCPTPAGRTPDTTGTPVDGSRSRTSQICRSEIRIGNSSRVRRRDRGSARPRGPFTEGESGVCRLQHALLLQGAAGVGHPAHRRPGVPQDRPGDLRGQGPPPPVRGGREPRRRPRPAPRRAEHDPLGL